MEFEEICSFLEITSNQLDVYWDIETLSRISNQRVPDFILSGRSSLLRADIHILWTQWFIESICNPELFIYSSSEYAYIVKAVQQRMPYVFSGISENEQNQLARYIARLVNEEVQRRKTRKRASASLDIRKELWDIYGPQPRCWICGYKFTKWAEDKFLGYSTNMEPPLPQFIDYMTLHGLTKRDISIEIDHAVPLSRGGSEEDNLRLACGWCNKYKSNRISLYDVIGQQSMIDHPKLGRQSIPHPFWVIRLLSVRRSCEYEKGCDKIVENSKLTVVYKHPKGAMNPTNLRVICLDHDPIGSDRFVSRQVVHKIKEVKP
ncbi:HNH endonuclease family protein [Lyngbya aestuarii BL J]|jgi:hypothetical protein|uniref:HNH endonuclease family protein n=1 Tax=Lyngbya aestuarii BL J TaxID=1348334 RepID=U7QHN1_9CYAN|nr:HNH endonuclease [Lyngbya aestuarii]ERT06797.1 HNH endonuclease family protein [Lyngbya aestuarii BL J]